MSEHATPEDCPCCHVCLAPGEDTERALVVAFLGGRYTRDYGVPIAAALCAKHSAMTGECLRFTLERARAGSS